MAYIGYHASHEQFPPGHLLKLAERAGNAGFDGAMCSDHFHPWSEAQGQSGHAWSWLGAALSTIRSDCGVVTCPAGRYHPAIVAQAAATLSAMFPGRFWLAVGSGEALNECITGEPWPEKSVRNQRLREAVQVMRALWAGEEVTHDGAVRVRDARLYTLPDRAPKILLAALSAETARWGASWTDGLITVSMPAERLRPIVDAFREHGGDAKPMYLQVKISYARDEETALRDAVAQWRTNVFTPEQSENLRTPAQYEALGRRATAQDVLRAVRVSADPGRHRQWLEEDLQLGFERLYLHNVNRRQEAFIDAFGSEVIPRLRGA